MITGWGLVAVTVPVGVFVGVLAIRRGEAGRGATMILVAILMPALALTVFADPAGMMYGPDGLLMFGRRMGFSTAQAVTHNGALSGAGLTAQVDTLTSSLITHVVREPLEVFNFGHVIDTVGGCAAQYSAALQRGAAVASVQGTSDGPVKAMARCGDAGAVYYAQNLDGTNVFVGRGVGGRCDAVRLVHGVLGCLGVDGVGQGALHHRQAGAQRAGRRASRVLRSSTPRPRCGGSSNTRWKPWC